jgi:hypothetical protein
LASRDTPVTATRRWARNVDAASLIVVITTSSRFDGAVPIVPAPAPRRTAASLTVAADFRRRNPRAARCRGCAASFVRRVRDGRPERRGGRRGRLIPRQQHPWPGPTTQWMCGVLP